VRDDSLDFSLSALHKPSTRFVRMLKVVASRDSHRRTAMPDSNDLAEIVKVTTSLLIMLLEL